MAEKCTKVRGDKRVQMLFKRMELILGVKSDLRRSRWPAGNPDNGTDCHAAQKAKFLVGELGLTKIKVRCASHKTVSSKSARCLLPYFPPADRGVCWGLRAGTKTWADGFRSCR